MNLKNASIISGSFGRIDTATIVAAGSVSSAGNFSVNTDKFTVASATGNTAVSGTLNVVGETRLNALTRVQGVLRVQNSDASYWAIDRDDTDGRLKILDDAASEKFSLATTGAVTLAGALAVTGVATFNDSIELGEFTTAARSAQPGIIFRYAGSGAGSIYMQLGDAGGSYSLLSNLQADLLSITNAGAVNIPGTLSIGLGLTVGRDITMPLTGYGIIWGTTPSRRMVFNDDGTLAVTGNASFGAAKIGSTAAGHPSGANHVLMTGLAGTYTYLGGQGNDNVIELQSNLATISVETVIGLATSPVRINRLSNSTTYGAISFSGGLDNTVGGFAGIFGRASDGFLGMDAESIGITGATSFSSTVAITGTATAAAFVTASGSTTSDGSAMFSLGVDGQQCLFTVGGRSGSAAYVLAHAFNNAGTVYVNTIFAQGGMTVGVSGTNVTVTRAGPITAIWRILTIPNF